MDQPKGVLTKARAADILHLFRSLSTDEPLVPIPLSREQFRQLIIASWEGHALDRWEAWRQLFNAGFRGRELSPLYGPEPR
jgi:hypothetical protein